ncbi:hypothetical protein PCC7418_1560 [Halothece sp. PCC 7418]|uniref:site-specific DNA-methyltransferase n=1 Tax=Halothece sp. (strain PCC 7418) TaxID=65093 RepID=UPI0002A05F91|nr:site-specific DNA-methyltransferase [Halothece sp. PCC 7418]AFZ43747.1 hypothetical protein PCC7418_1560 [Halothece sp. PCC 7418]
MFQQLSLFQTNIDQTQRDFYETIRESGFEYEEVDIGDITFKAGQQESIHRWYRLTPSYSPALVRYLIQKWNITREHFVIDPFSGKGTTSIECQKHGIKTLGLEINPLLQQVTDKSLRWDLNSLDQFDNYFNEVSNLITQYQEESIETVVSLLKTNLPIIHNVFRWWKKDVLKNLLICREVMLDSKYLSIQDYLWVAVNNTCLDCANIHRNHPTITFDDNHTRKINVLDELNKNLRVVLEDLSSLNREEISYSELGQVKLGNATNNLRQQIDTCADFVITSPPYPNRYSYVHQTRPQLYFMEVLSRVQEATEIDLNAVGGTWGKATSNLQSELITVPPELQTYLCYYEELKDKSILMCNYATKYFIDMWKHIKSLKEVKAEEFRGAYVVGNSRLSGVEIFTESILGKLFRHEGFEVEKIVSFRKRGGRKRLYETAILIRG